MPDTFVKYVDGDEKVCGILICKKVVEFRMHCRHGAEFNSCGQAKHIEYQLKAAMERDGYDGIRVMMVRKD